MANIYSTTPSVKKKDVLDVVQSKAQGYQQKYNFITVELPASAWTKVEDPDSQLFGGYTQTVKTDAEGTAIAFEVNDVVLVDADDVNAERLADYNVCAEVFDDGLVFYCDGVTSIDEDENETTVPPTETIIADVVVFPYSGATKMATPSIVEVLDNIETLLDGKY